MYKVTNTSEEDFDKLIYSGDARHVLKIHLDRPSDDEEESSLPTEIENADDYCEKMTIKSNILATDGKERFSLDNFIAKEVDLILHDIDINIFDEAQLRIELDTLISDSIYEFTQMGIFNIQDVPVTDKDKITIKLKDNSKKFDIPYNAKTIIDQNGGSATKKQILDDICLTCGVEHNIESFIGENDPIGIYDNSINARVYISYIAEQAGAIATIDREGKLIFIYLNDAKVQKIPIEVVEKFEVAEPYEITRVEYEDAIRKYTAGEGNKDTLYLNSANPYVSSQEQVDTIYKLLQGFKIDSFNTGKILGNPRIDPYDLIEITDYDDKVYKTLANNTFTYNGKCIQTFNTTIGKEARKSNVSLKSQDTFRKWARTEIDNVNAEIKLQAGQIEEVGKSIEDTNTNLNNNYYNRQSVETLILNSSTGVTNTFSEAGGNNVLRNTYFSAKEVLEEGQEYEFWYGHADRIINNNSVNNYAIRLKKTSLYQEQIVGNGNYTLSFMYKKLNPLATTSVVINGNEYTLDKEDWALFQTGLKKEDETYYADPIIITDTHLKVEFKTDRDDAIEIYDIMCNVGTVKLAYSQNQNETITDTVNIGKGITITSTTSDTKFVATTDAIGFKSTTNNDMITEFTNKGMTTKEAAIENKAEIVGILRQRVGEQVWDSLMV